ncbi:MAG TPA: ATP-binding protein [Planctomycetota bacterium]|nr:ATP-binding protein [Planctomycetota bacterium]
MSPDSKSTAVVVSIPEHTAYLSVVRQAVASIAGTMGFDDDAVLQLQMAVDEACTNVIEHGRGGRGGRIKVKLQAKPGKLVMHVEDQRERFSPLERTLPSRDAYFQSPQTGGLGILILRRFVDDVRHCYKPGVGNKLSLTKLVPQDGGATCAI